MTTVLGWIQFLVQRDLDNGEVVFTWFGIENQDGICKRKHGADKSLGDVISQDFGHLSNLACVIICI